jgi:hypothetical protein
MGEVGAHWGKWVHGNTNESEEQNAAAAQDACVDIFVTIPSRTIRPAFPGTAQ